MAKRRAGSDVTDVAYATEDELVRVRFDRNGDAHFAKSFRDGTRAADGAEITTRQFDLTISMAPLELVN